MRYTHAMRRKLRAGVFLVATVVFGLVVTQTRAENAIAERYVEGLIATAVEILSDTGISDERRQTAFQDFLADNVDMRRLPAFLLGQYARTPTDEQKVDYLNLLQEFMTRIYLVRLQQYADDAITVTGSRDRKNGREVVVTGTIQLPNRAQPLSLDWWLLQEEQDDGTFDFHVFDVRVAGIWLAQEQRSGFVSVIRNNQGSFDALLQHLRKQIDSQASAHAQ